MSDPSYPVTVAVQRPDGTVEHVRVGTAVRSGDGFRLSLGELAIGGAADAAGLSRRTAPPPASDGGPVFPPYGRSKGAPIAGASMQDLEFYANGCRRTLNDQAKARWHDKERALLAVIESEMARQGGSTGGGNGGTGGGTSGYSGYGGGGGYGGYEPPPFDDRAPPRSDDDIPF